MIAEIGHLALILAFLLAIVQAVTGLWGGARRDLRLIAGARASALLQLIFVAMAFGALAIAYLTPDFSVALVVAHSHSTQPWPYRLAATWGSHEGSLLLWVLILAIYGAVAALFGKRLRPTLVSRMLGVQALIAVAFLGFSLLTSNPFLRLDPAPLDGQELNPLLQDPGLVLHPPLLYLGYVGFSAAFSLAAAALIEGRADMAFARWLRPWIIAAWSTLTLGIALGSWWAYYELGWGGWWFWDPVENASLMPWLAATALLHSVNVLAARDGLRAWTLMLAVVAFSMSMLGTFLVRSGILTSVHAFAVDPTRGSFILVLLALYIGGALLLFALRAGTVRAGQGFDPLSREGGLVLNNLLLTVILGIVLIGTLYPIAAQAMGEQLSVGPPFFNKTTGPIALILVAAMAIGPLLKWRRDDANAVLGKLTAPVAAAMLAMAATFVFASDTGWMELVALGLAAGLAVASFAPLWKRNLLRTPLFTWGMVVAHFGVAVSLAGMAADSAFTKERLVAAVYGQPYQVGPWRVVLDGVGPAIGDNWTAVEGRLTARRDDSSTILMRPQRRFYPSPPTDTAEAAIETRWNGQLYAVLGEQDAQGRWQLRLWWKPFVTLIWFGGGLIALGGALSLFGRLFRERRNARRREEAE